MDDKNVEQITESTQRLVAAAEALQKAMIEISAQQAEISAKIDKIVAAIEEKAEGTTALAVEAGGIPHLPKDGRYRAPSVTHFGRKTLSPMVTMILAKSGVEDGAEVAMLDKALATLAPEQRIAVKSEMARAGIIQ